jgi:hypothetical protein
VGDPSRSAPQGIRIFIHHDAASADDAALAPRLADHLRQEGFVIADIRPVDLRIDAPSVRYFFDRDRSDGRRLVEELNRFFDSAPNRAPARASDFTHYTPKPHPGNVEVWLSTS